MRLHTNSVAGRSAGHLADHRQLSGIHFSILQERYGYPRKKVLRTRHEQARDEQTPMKYEQSALEYSAITMETLRNQGVDIQAIAGAVIDFAKRNTLSKGHPCKPILIGQNIAFDIGFMQQLMNYAGLSRNLKKCFQVPRTTTVIFNLITSTRFSSAGWHSRRMPK